LFDGSTEEIITRGITEEDKIKTEDLILD